MKKILREHGAYQHWPVPGGFGESTVDCLACVYGCFLAIETKGRRQDQPTGRQTLVLRKVRAAGGYWAIVRGLEAIPAFVTFMDRLREKHGSSG